MLVQGGSTKPKVTVHPDDLKRLLGLFQRLDENEDGVISRAEIIKV